jgi:peroxiredoxin
MIQMKEPIPSLNVRIVRRGHEPQTVSTSVLFRKKTLLMSIPGAFTPVCSSMHIPGLIQKMPQILAKGVEQIVCLAMNDPFVMTAWAEQLNAPGDLVFLADGNGELSHALGILFDGSANWLGQRNQRMALLIQNSVVEKLWVEPDTAFCTVSSAVYILNDLVA